MDNTCLDKIPVDPGTELRPVQPGTLTASPQQLHPAPDDLHAEATNRWAVAWDTKIVDVPADNPIEPRQVLAHWLMHALPQFAFDRLNLFDQPHARCLSSQLEATTSAGRAVVR